MLDKRTAQIKRALAGDMAFTNVLVGLLMTFFESLWIVVFFDSGRIVLGDNLGWDVQLITVAAIVLLTAPYLLASLFMASSMAEEARRIVGVCSVIIGLAAAVFTVGLWMEVGTDFRPSYLISRFPWILFGIFVLLRLRLFKQRMAQT